MRTTATIILALVALAGAPALACTSPATGTLEDMMAQATWTRETGSSYTRRDAKVHVALPALAPRGFGCLTWNVALVLPQGVSMATDDEGDATASSRTGLAADAVATFDVRLGRRAHNSEIRYEQGWLRIRVRNPLDNADVFLNRQGGSPLWIYPVVFQLAGD